MEPPTPVDGQPIFGSVWKVPNVFQRAGNWKPDVNRPPHPMACTENKPFKKLRRQATIESVPRTTDPESAEDPSLLPLPTDAGDPVHCNKLGTFLCRYRVPVLREGYTGFSLPVFLGELSTESKTKLSDHLQLLKALG